jgi:hypothetical protein
MITKQRKRPRLGDIVEVPVPRKGFAYVHYVKEHRGYGSLLRVLPGLFKKRRTEVAELAEGKELYLVFFPLGVALHRGHLKIVGEGAVPERFGKWPLFRAFNENIDTGVRTWFLWDGQKYLKIGRLPKKYYDLSFPGTLNLTELENRLAQAWLPRDVI